MVTNLNLRRRLGAVTLITGASNLFDEHYATFTRTPIAGGAPNRGRMLYAGMEVSC